MVSGGSAPSGVAAAPAMSAELAGLCSEAGVAAALVKWCEQTGIHTVRNLGNFCDSADQVADRILSASGLYSNNPSDKPQQREFNMEGGRCAGLEASEESFGGASNRGY